MRLNILITVNIKKQFIMKRILLLSSFLFCSIILIGQINSVSYGIEYNPKTCLFDCYVRSLDGDAVTMKERVQFNAQFTVVIPKGSEAVVEKVYMPYRNNQNYRSSDAIDWYISSTIEGPKSSPENTFVSVAPSLAPSAFYNNIEQGEKLVLFSLNISPIVNCAKDVRIFDNATDPSSSDLGMGGSDFRNGFTIGGIEQKYLRNERLISPQEPEIHNLAILSKKYGEVNFESRTAMSDCQKKLEYKWVTPNGKILYSDSPEYTFNHVEEGKYKVIISDAIGCSASKEFYFLESTKGNELAVIANDTEVDYRTNLVSGVSFFPNPAKDNIQFRLNGKKGDLVEIDLHDFRGKKMQSTFSYNLNGTEDELVLMPVKYPSGMYTITSRINGELVKSEKLIIID